MLSNQERYIRAHTSTQSEALAWLEKQTNIRTNYPQMLTGTVQGRLLTILVRMMGARRILEIGTFTGYSSICMAYGLQSGGHIDTLEINDELEELIREAWQRAGVEDLIELHIGDACETLKTLCGPYDLIYLDANKREYCSYYELALPLLRQGGVIIADDVMQGGKVYEDDMPVDKQTRGLAEFNDMVIKDRRVETVMLPIRDGMSMTIKL